MAGLSRPFIVLAALTALITPSLSVPLEARQNGFVSITGPSVGGVQPRLEIRDVQANSDYFNLFILATKRFQDMRQNDKLSYFQISGIHGQPLIDWDNSHSGDGNTNLGYCPHSSNLFGPWHRPYLSIFEQVLSVKAAEILNEFPNGLTKDRYRDIHSRLRLPYWDWAKRTSANEPILPNAVTQATVAVTFPNGTRATIPNPLLLYRFHPLKPEYFTGVWKGDPTTIRGDSVESNLQSWMPDTKRTLYQILTQWQTYNQFSNHGSRGSFIGNLESIHDTIHVTFGDAHMSDPAVAAFDPVFWLHHANVDRLLAIWQRIYPDTYVDPYIQQSGGTWTIPPLSTQDATSPLTPFHKNKNGDYHTSDTSRTTDAFQYTYPEIQGNPSNATLKATVNRLYTPDTTSITKRQTEETAPELRLSPSQPRAFVAAIEAPLHFVGAYSVEVFLGEITVPTSEWINDPNFVGGQSMMTRIANEDIVIKGSVVLTDALKEKYNAGQLKSLETDAVVAYLKDNLHWRVQDKAFNEEIPREGIPNFKINVLSTEVKPAESAEEFPTYVGEWQEHPEVTAGRPGGVEA